MKRTFRILVVLLFLVSMFAVTAAAAPGGDSYSAALDALKSGDGHKAVTLLSKAIDAHPRDFRYYNDRGVAYRMMGDMEKAIADYSRAIELKPDYTNALNNRGVVHLQQRLYDRAIQDFSEALRYGGLESKVYTNLGAAYAAKGDHRNAIKYFDAAISLRPMDYRAFIFMGETLEKIGDKERALKMYRLGLGLIPDTSLSGRVEKRVAAIEKALIGGRQSADKGAGIQPRPADSPSPQKSESARPAKAETSQSRKIMLARPIPHSAPEAPKPAVASAENGVETLEGLESRARARVIGKIAPASAEILRQGHEFLEKNDSTKALVRFEDTLQLERRKRNEHGVAWSSFEIGKVYSKLGDQVKATAYFDAALRIFRKLKASDEVVLTLLEAAVSKAKAGQKDQAAALYSAAASMAVSAGHPVLSKLIANLAAGKTPYEPPKPTVAAARQLKGEGRTASVADAAGRASAQPPVPRSKQTIVAPIRDAHAKEAPRQADELGRRVQPAQTGSAKTDGPQPEIARKLGQGLQTQARTTQAGKKVTAPAGVAGSTVQRTASSMGASTTGSKVKETSLDNRIREDLSALKQLRASNNEAAMAALLERLAGNFIRRKDYRKASYCLTTSLALQDKLGSNKGRQKMFYQSGLLKEKLGDPAGAIEDLTRSMALSGDKASAGTVREMDAKVRNIAKRLNIDAVALLAAFQMLWKARTIGDDHTETEALYAIGKLYDRSEKHAEALNYYERSSASMFIDKARMHQKMGNARLAQDAYGKALEVFRKLDYSRYVGLVKKIRSPRVFSKQ